MSDMTALTDQNTLLDQLAESRERLRAERAEWKPKLAEAERLNRESKATHRRVRKAAARYLKRFRKAAAAETAPIRAAREEIARQQDDLAVAFAKLTDERHRVLAETVEARESLKRAWDLLDEQRKAFAHEQTERDAELSRLFQLLEGREREAAATSEQLRHDRHRIDGEVRVLRSEADGLDRRIANARLQLQELEQQRARATAHRTSGAAFVPDLVALATGNEIPPNQLSALQLREEDLQRERRELDAMRKGLDALAEFLTDQRRVLAEQIDGMAEAKDAWRSAESRTVDELEELARAVEFRESLLTAREVAMTRHEENRRERERELWKYQTTLDQWHALLTDRENRFLAERERAEVDLATRRGLVADREAELDAISQKWGADHARLREGMLDAIAEWRRETAEGRAVVVECERMRRDTQEQAAKLAAWILAVEQQNAESITRPENAKTTRRLAVLRNRWETRFARSLMQLDRRLAQLDAVSASITARHADFHKLAADATERQRQLAQSERQFDRTRILATNRPADEPIILAVADAWRRRSDAEIQKLKRSAELAADALLDADAKNDIVLLRAAEAA